jgi:hypothetical protein
MNQEIFKKKIIISITEKERQSQCSWKSIWKLVLNLKHKGSEIPLIAQKYIHHSAKKKYLELRKQNKGDDNHIILDVFIF